MFIIFRKWTAIYVISLIVLIIGFSMIMQQGKAIQASADTVDVQIPTIIIDAGHGGEDGGAVSADGTEEAKINLAIAHTAADLAHFLGWQVCMTREEDVSLHDNSAQTIREKKVSDLKNRVELCNSFDNCVLISIHQNSLPSAKSVRGAQVFYGNSEGSKELALSIQNVLNQTINNGRSKEIKYISGNYLMKHVLPPAILIECGFLSNAEETELLKSKNHQRKLALSIIAAVTIHLKN